MGFLAQTFSPPTVNLSDIQTECDRISNIIAHAIRPQKIILFGSAAEGRFTAFSDLDILIVVKTEQEIRDARFKLAAQVILPKWPCDYLFATLDRFNEMKDQGGPIYMAHHFGKVLYDQRTIIQA